jgi:choline dehydrogenase-like flavoprotein
MAREQYDVIVMGAGHNGLVTAGYLAKAGLRTLVVERRGRAGGLLATEDVVPGVRVPVAADGVGGLSAGVVQDLGLASHGFHALEPDVVAFAPPADGASLTLWRDPVRTATELRSRSQPRDAEAFLDFDRQIRSLAASWRASRRPSRRIWRRPLSRTRAPASTLMNALRHLGRRAGPRGAAGTADVRWGLRERSSRRRGATRPSRHQGRSLLRHGAAFRGNRSELPLGLSRRRRRGRAHRLRAWRTGSIGRGARRSARSHGADVRL